MTQKLQNNIDINNEKIDTNDGFIIDKKVELFGLKSDINLSSKSIESFLSNIEGKLDDPLFEDMNNFQFFVKWAKENMFLNIKQVKNYDWKNNKYSCLKKSDKKNSPPEFTLILPEDLDLVKISDIPFIIKQINILSLGENLPENASWLELGTYLTTLIKFLEDNNKTELVKKYIKIYGEYFNNGETFDIDNTILSSFNNLININSETFDDDIEGQVNLVFKKHLFESLFEGGTRMLYEYMKAPGSDEYGSLKEYLDPFYLKLEDARKIGDTDKIVKAEKVLIKKIFYKVSNYLDYPSDLAEDSPYKTVWSSQNLVDEFTFSANVLEKNIMLCLSKTILIQGLLDNYNIKNEVIKKHKHIFNLVTTSDNKTYIIDGTQSGYYIFALNRYKGTNIGNILSESNGIIDKEDVILSDMLLNSIKFGYLTTRDIFPLELAIKINPDNVSAMFQLGVIYFNSSQKQKGYELLIECKKKLNQIRKNRNNKNEFRKLELEIDKKIEEMKKYM